MFKKTIGMKAAISNLRITIPTQKVQGPLTPRPVPLFTHAGTIVHEEHQQVHDMATLFTHLSTK
jgi:hypothetical protein